MEAVRGNCRAARIAARALFLGLAMTGGAIAQQAPVERSTTWPDGTPKERWFENERQQKHGAYEQWTETGVRIERTVYSNGKRSGEHREWRPDGSPICTETWSDDARHGPAQAFHPDGKVASTGSYRLGKRTGKWIDTDAAATRERTGEFRDGLLHGTVTVRVRGKVASKQTWKSGELTVLDGVEAFPVPRERLLSELRTILATPLPAPATPSPKLAAPPLDPRASLRHAALVRLRAYRHLCGLPHAEMQLVPAWNDFCDAAAEVCKRNGGISHHPPRPAGFDEARYRQGAEGASRSNLAVCGSLAESVDNYMDDSDPSNIDRVGHRRWCLNPTMQKTGFGTDERYHAMWSLDSSGAQPRGVQHVLYPPRGWVPVDMFGARHAFSISSLRGSMPDEALLRTTIRPLDDDWLPGEALPDDVLLVSGGGYGGGPALIFRKKDLIVAAGKRYLVEVRGDGGKTLLHCYVVAFCEAAAPS